MFRVLVIDDEEDVLKAVRRRLERDGYIVSTAPNAEAGAKMVAEEDRPFDVVVTDMSMEDPNAGLKILQAAFARDIFAEVIVMTAYGNVANAVECMRRGAYDYIEKNVPGVDAYEVLSEKVDDAIERRRRDVQAVTLWERVANSVKHRGESHAPGS